MASGARARRGDTAAGLIFLPVYLWSFELKIIGSNSFYDENLVALMDMIQDGRLKPVIDEVLPLERTVESLRMIEKREVFGKVVVMP